MHLSTVSHLGKCKSNCCDSLHSSRSPCTAGRRPSAHASSKPVQHIANSSVTKATALANGDSQIDNARPRSRSPGSYQQRSRQPRSVEGSFHGEVQQQQQLYERQQSWNQQQESPQPMVPRRQNAAPRAAKQQLSQKVWLQQKKMGAARDQAASFFVHATQLDEICEGLQLYEGVLSPSMLAHTVGPKLTSLLGQLPKSSAKEVGTGWRKQKGGGERTNMSDTLSSYTVVLGVGNGSVNFPR
eukprot:1157446-Pelagomonas_calceolata.AAC.11